MECVTGVLIDLVEKAEDSEKQTQYSNSDPAVPSSQNESAIHGFAGTGILNKQLSKGTDHSSPACGVLVDLDFDGSPLTITNSLTNPSVSIKVQNCDTSTKFAEQIVCDASLPGTSREPSLLKKSKYSSASSSSSGGSRCQVNFSWSPSIIYNADVDLLENEKFDFNLSMTSISPYRGHDDVFLTEENTHKRCCCKYEKTPKLSTPQKNWSLMNAAFVSEISDEASRFVTHLSSQKMPLQSSAVDMSEFSPLLLDANISLSHHNDSGIEEQELNPDDGLKNKWLEKQVEREPQCTMDTDDTTCVSTMQREHIKTDNVINCEVIHEAAIGDVTNIAISNGESGRIDECIISNLNAISLGSNCVDENKENTPSPGSKPAHSENDYDSEDRNLTKMPLSEQQNTIDVSDPPKVSSPIVRRDTFTVKSSPLQISKKSSFKSKNNNEETRKSFCTPKGGVYKVRQNASVSNPGSISLSKKADTPNRVSLSRKGTYTVSPASRSRNTPVVKDQGTAAPTNLNTPTRAVSRVSSLAEKAGILSSKVIPKSRTSSPQLKVSTNSAIKSNSKEPVPSVFKTPTLPKRSSVLPSRRSFDSHDAVKNTTRVGTPLQSSPPKVTRGKSFQLPRPPNGAVLMNKKSIYSLAGKLRSNSADEFPSSGLCKKSEPLKAIAPLSNMVKPAAFKSPPTRGVSNIIGNRGKNPTPLVGRGGVQARATSPLVGKGGVQEHATALKTEQSKRSNSLSTPTLGSTPSKPRFLSQSGTPSTPVSQKKGTGVRRLSFVPTPKRLTSQKCTESF